MEIVAHGLWTTAAAITASSKTRARFNLVWTAWWGVFPDVLAFGPGIVVGLALALGGAPASGHDHFPPRVHIGLPLYPAGHSLIVFAAVFAMARILSRRVLFPMLGWLLHILIDIPTHSYGYYPTRFLWPASDFGVDGIAWWTRWFWAATYAALGVAYFILWKKGWLAPGRTRPAREAATTR